MGNEFLIRLGKIGFGTICSVPNRVQSKQFGLSLKFFIYPKIHSEINTIIIVIHTYSQTPTKLQSCLMVTTW